MLTRLTVVSALTMLPRHVVVRHLAGNSGTVAIAYQRLGHRLLERRVVQGSTVLETSRVPLVAVGVVDAVRQDLRDTMPSVVSLHPSDVVVGLPAGLDAEVVLIDMDVLGEPFQLDSVITAVDPAHVEDVLWENRTLRDRGAECIPGDRRTCGDFVVGELLHSDVYVLVDTAPSSADSSRGRCLISHVAPQACATEIGPDSSLPAPVLGAYRRDPAEVRARTEPGAVVVPVLDESQETTTAVCRSSTPLHPTRLHERMAELAAGSVWSRGRLWIASVPRQKMVWWGVGPQVGLEQWGSWLADCSTPGDVPADTLLDWHPRFGDRGTMLAFTGSDVDAADLQRLLDECALTEEEWGAGETDWARLEDTLSLHEMFPDKPDSTRRPEGRFP